MIYAGIIIDISHEKLDRIFQYSVPEKLRDKIDVGSKVLISFNRRKISGYVVELSEEPNFDPSRIIPIEGIADNGVPLDMRRIKLAYWIKENYGSTIINALKTVMPVKDRVRQEKRKTVKLLLSKAEAVAISGEFEKKNKKAQARVLQALAEGGITEYALLTTKLNVSSTSLRALEEKGYIEINTYEVFRNIVNTGKMEYSPVVLNDEQRKTADEIIHEIDCKDFTPCLIKGVTGSGKTEVYMELIDHIIKEGKEAIVLIPEIALTYQTVMRFYARFNNLVSIINSRLSKGEKYDRFRMASEGKIKIMIGPRSALFTPFNNLGLIIIDEEHESAYQNDNTPRYHARETAIEIAKMYGAKVVLGSATPSLEAFYRAKSGEYHLFRLDNRAGNAQLPKVDVVDLREELHKGNRTVFSDRLRELIIDRLEKKEQIMLFLNRRGQKGIINCRDCGKVLKCPHCDVSLTQHNNSRLICHYCGYETEYVKKCPVCNSANIGTFKIGTEGVEEQIKKVFPEAAILRMDADTTKGKEGHAAILEKFANHEADVLIGTQMIVKGHDFSNVTLVGVLLADTSLHSQDYRASEITFDILTQAAGRAGRGDKSGNVVIQTYDPDNFCITTAAAQDYEAFYDMEIEYRRIIGYPPVRGMLSAKIGSADEKLLAKVSEYIKELTDDIENVTVVGPANASIYKIKDIFYRMIYYKSMDRDTLIRIKDTIEKEAENNPEIKQNIKIVFDFR